RGLRRLSGQAHQRARTARDCPTDPRQFSAVTRFSESRRVDSRETRMNRRAFVTGLGAVLAAPLAVRAQPTSKMPRIALVQSNPTRNANTDAFDAGLHDLGYVAGQNVTIEYRFSDARIDRLRLLVEEVLRLGVNVICAGSPYVIRAARQATSTVPIVGIDLETDPIEAGWVKSLSNPGGNLTGFFL